MDRHRSVYFPRGVTKGAGVNWNGAIMPRLTVKLVDDDDGMGVKDNFRGVLRKYAMKILSFVFHKKRERKIVNGVDPVFYLTKTFLVWAN